MKERESSQDGISFILGGLFLLFLIICLRFHHNVKFAGVIFRDLVEIKIRHNVFDDTVRETSFMILLNIMWCACAGIIAWGSLTNFGFVTSIIDTSSQGILLGMLMATLYCLAMCVLYFFVGWIFSDLEHSRIWLKGFTASQALMTPLFFMIALISICWPSLDFPMFIFSAGIFLVARLMFIWKGYRIFFSQFSSWVLFLCYLCSLEIVPLIFTYRMTIRLWRTLC